MRNRPTVHPTLARKALIPLLCSFFLVAAAAFLLLAPIASKPRELTGKGASAGTRRPNPAAKKASASARSMPQKFLTLNQGDTIDLSPGPVSFGGHPRLVKRIGISWKFRADTPGHTVLTVGVGASKRQVYLFVSPLPSRHVTREDLDWYRSQFDTGGIANCGPADVAMAILWARGKDIPVQDIREEIGFPYEDGSTTFPMLAQSLDRHNVHYKVADVAAPKDLVGVMDRGHIAIMLVQTGVIGKVEGDPVKDLVGKYYDDDQGHYLVIKGYSLDGRYFVVYDPYPVDWEENRPRYGDDVSMIGKNRYYQTSQLFAALKTSTILEVQPN
jgi:hypothetical protein